MHQRLDDQRAVGVRWNNWGLPPALLKVVVRFWLLMEIRNRNNCAFLLVICTPFATRLYTAVQEPTPGTIVPPKVNLLTASGLIVHRPIEGRYTLYTEFDSRPHQTINTLQFVSVPSLLGTRNKAYNNLCIRLSRTQAYAVVTNETQNLPHSLLMLHVNWQLF